MGMEYEAEMEEPRQGKDVGSFPFYGEVTGITLTRMTQEQMAEGGQGQICSNMGENILSEEPSRQLEDRLDVYR